MIPMSCTDWPRSRSVAENFRICRRVRWPMVWQIPILPPALVSPRVPLRQFARLGTFTFLFPHASHQPPPEGLLSFRIAASRPGHPPVIDVITPPDNGARVLPLNLPFCQ